MKTLLRALGAALLVCLFACRKTEDPLIVHVMRDPSASFKRALTSADLQYSLTKPHLKSGRSVMIATYAGGRLTFAERAACNNWDLLVLDAESDLRDEAVKRCWGTPTPVCGGHPAYIGTWVSSEVREAASAYIEYLASHCKEEPLS